MSESPKPKGLSRAEQNRRTYLEAYIPPAKSALGIRMAKNLLTAPLFRPRITTLRK